MYLLIVTSLSGQSESLVDTEETAIRQRVNENYELSFTAIKTPNNQYGYDLLQDEAMITCENENFIIKSLQELPYSKTVVAVHEFFEIIDDYVEETLVDGIYSIQNALEHAFSNTPDWSYVVDGAFGSALLQDFGGDNPVALLQTILETFNAEYTVSSKDKIVRVTNQIGVETDYQVRFKHNLSAINREVDASSVKTAVKVYYNPDGYGGYDGNVIYYSPYRDKYRRIKWAEPIYLDDVVEEAHANSYAKNQLQDTPVVSITTEFVHLQDGGYDGSDIALGNSFYLIDERLNISESARIVEIESYPFDKGKSPVIVCSNKRKTMEGLAINQQLQHHALDYAAVKQKDLYNGVNINKEDGIKVTSGNGVTLWLNATNGILITKDGKQEFYADTEGNLSFDGRLNITENGQTLLESYMDTNGGVMLINDVDGARNVRIGSESGDGEYQGGIINLYDGGSTDAHLRFQAGTLSATGDGFMTVRGSNGRIRIFAYAGQQGFGTVLGVADENGVIRSYINDVSGQINGQEIATRNWVNSQGFLSSLPDFVLENDLLITLQQFENSIKQYIAANYQPL